MDKYNYIKFSNSKPEKKAAQSDVFFKPSVVNDQSHLQANTLPVTIQRKEINDTPTADSNLENYVGNLSGKGQSLPNEVRNFYEPKFGYDFSNVKIHQGDVAAASAQSINALAYTTGNNIVFNQGQYAPDTASGKRLLGHELTHVIQQNGASGKVQREDWDFTPADYKALKKTKKDLSFDSDSDWVPQKLRDNILASVKFILSSTKPVRTAGVNTKDLFHGHIVVPDAAVTKDLRQKTDDVFLEKNERLEKALGKTDKVTTKNLNAYIKATKEVEQFSTSLLNDAIALKGTAVLYHTYEYSMPSSMKAGSSVRNIMTPIGGTPAGYSPPNENDAGSYIKDYKHVFQFAFLVDEKGVIHLTVGTTSNLSKVTGTPMN